MGSTLWFDVTTLWFSRGSPPDGIPRTIISYMIGLMKRTSDIKFCRYERGEFIALSEDEAKALAKQFETAKSTTFSAVTKLHALTQKVKSAVCATLEKLADDTISQLSKKMRDGPKNPEFCLHLMREIPKRVKSAFRDNDPRASRMKPLPFRRGDVLLIMGFLWIQLPYERFAEEMPQLGYHVVTVIYDLIPVVLPELFNNRIQDKHLENVILGSSLLFAISDCTASDIATFAARRGIRRPKIYRIYLGNDPFKSAPKDKPACFESLTAGEFVLYVSTLNYRKNHEMLYGIWRDLYETHRPELIPLVLVGDAGPLSRSFLELLHKTHRLYPEYIKHFPGLNDSQLAWLYAHCRFTVFPSFYEGWGLPICEAMGYGKTCVSSNSTSLVEAGAGLTELIRPFDYYAWKEKILSFIIDDTILKEKETAIHTTYKPVSWEEGVSHFVSTLNVEYPDLFIRNM